MQAPRQNNIAVKPYILTENQKISCYVWALHIKSNTRGRQAILRQAILRATPATGMPTDDGTRQSP
jgi:hypothetical protein